MIEGMHTLVLLSYLLIIVSVAVWGVIPVLSSRVRPGLLRGVSTFAGAFLLASCFVNIVPHLFIGIDKEHFVAEAYGMKIGGAVVVGLLLQMLIERLTGGIGHGEQTESLPRGSIAGLMIGLCVHAFLEGMPLVSHDGDIHQGLLYGIALHNVPIALVLTALLWQQGAGAGKTMVLLLLFGIMTPLGSVFNLVVLPGDTLVQNLLMGLVVGILLHVGAGFMSSHDEAPLSWRQIVLVAIAFVAAYLTPGCPEIYPNL